jgi:hypothetical protein
MNSAALVTSWIGLCLSILKMFGNRKLALEMKAPNTLKFKSTPKIDINPKTPPRKHHARRKGKTPTAQPRLQFVTTVYFGTQFTVKLLLSLLSSFSKCQGEDSFVARRYGGLCLFVVLICGALVAKFNLHQFMFMRAKVLERYMSRRSLRQIKFVKKLRKLETRVFAVSLVVIPILWVTSQHRAFQIGLAIAMVIMALLDVTICGLATHLFLVPLLKLKDAAVEKNSAQLTKGGTKKTPRRCVFVYMVYV